MMKDLRLRAEHGQERRSNLDPLLARQACERLAAVLVLTGRRDIRADETDPEALDATTVLSFNSERWTEREVRQLLSCGLFHPSVGGRIRFAHRQLQDYMAAGFFNRAINANAGSLDIVDLLFATGLGPKQVPQSTEHVVGWLSSINSQVRQLVTRLRPALLIESGESYRSRLASAWSPCGGLF